MPPKQGGGSPKAKSAAGASPERFLRLNPERVTHGQSKTGADLDKSAGAGASKEKDGGSASASASGAIGRGDVSAWQRIEDPATGEVMYFNMDTGEETKERPAGFAGENWLHPADFTTSKGEETSNSKGGTGKTKR